MALLFVANKFVFLSFFENGCHGNAGPLATWPLTLHFFGLICQKRKRLYDSK